MRTKQLFKEIAPDYNPKFDPWGHAMGAFFAVCDEIQLVRGLNCDFEWGYDPGPCRTGPEPDCYESEVLAELAPTDDELLRLGRFLHRLTGRLDRAGHSY